MRYEMLNAGSYLVWRLQYADMVTLVQDEGDVAHLRMKQINDAYHRIVAGMTQKHM